MTGGTTSTAPVQTVTAGSTGNYLTQIDGSSLPSFAGLLWGAPGPASGSTPPMSAPTNYNQLYYASFAVTSAQIKALSTVSGLTLISAPASTDVINIVYMSGTFLYVAPAYATGTGNIKLTVGTTSAIVTSIVSNATLIGSANAYAFGPAAIVGSAAITAAGQPAQLLLTTGSQYVTGNGTMIVKLLYTVSAVLT
jgi:hypothetical protein